MATDDINSQVPGTLFVRFEDEQGCAVLGRKTVLATASGAPDAPQVRVETYDAELALELPPGLYNLQVSTDGHRPSSACTTVEPGGGGKVRLTTERSDAEPASLRERLRAYGKGAPREKDLPDLRVGDSDVVLTPRDEGAPFRAVRLETRSIADVKRWTGVPDGAFADGFMRFGPIPRAIEALQDCNLDVSLLSSNDRSALDAVAREHIHGNSRATAKYVDLLDGVLAQLADPVRVLVYFLNDVTIDAGRTLEVGPGTTVFFANVLRIHETAVLRLSEECRIDAWRLETFH